MLRGMRSLRTLFFIAGNVSSWSAHSNEGDGLDTWRTAADGTEKPLPARG